MRRATTQRNAQTAILGPRLGDRRAGPHPGQHPAGTEPEISELHLTTASINNNPPGMVGLSSFHPGGANVLMGDGSVRFLKDSTNMQTIWKLASRNGGEIISADEF